MNTVIIKQLSLKNFKKIKDLTVEFSNETNILGNNGVDKTTIFDAFTWLLFGKDHLGRTDSGKGRFEVKTLNSDNTPIHKLEHSVTGEFIVNNEPLKLQRVYKEKWVKKQGTSDPVMDGHETLFYINDVPEKKGTYESKVSQIIDESVFKIITNPATFCELPWKHQREILIKLAGINDDDSSLMYSNEEFRGLLDKLTGKDLEGYSRQLSERKKRLKKDLDAIPPRIDEVRNGMPEAIDYDQITSDLADKEKEIREVEQSIVDKSKPAEKYYKEKSEWESQRGKLKLEISRFESEASNQISLKLNEKTSIIQSIQGNIERIKDRILFANDQIKEKQEQVGALTEQKSQLLEKWHTVNKSTPDNPVCPFTNNICTVQEVVDTSSEVFNKNKIEQKSSINTKGKALKEKIELINTSINELNEGVKGEEIKLQQKQEELTRAKNAPAGVQTVQSILKDNSEYQSLINQLNILDQKEDQFNATPDVDDKDLKLKKSLLVSQRDELKKQLNTREEITRAGKRIIELEHESKFLAQQISDIEKDEYLIEQYTKFKIDTVEGPINRLFPTVKFKLFEEQINGGISETCEALINGVPWRMTNTAAQIQSGIEIINRLCEHFQVLAPIFIDRRESVIHIPETQSQIINLIVDKEYKQLKIA